MFYCLNNYITIDKVHDFCCVSNLVIGETLYGDESAYIFLSSLGYEPQPIEVIASNIMKSFVGVTREEVVEDAIAYFDSLVPALIIASGHTIEECLDNRTFFSYENKDKIIEGFCSFDSFDNVENVEVSHRGNYVLRSLHIELTSRCNERCIHCYIPHEMKTVDMSEDTFLRIVDSIKEMKIKSVTLSGGECMYHPRFIEYLRLLKNMGLRVKLLTNLTLLNDEIIDILKTGLFSSVQTSLFSLDEKVHDSITQVPGSWKKTMANIDLLRKNNIVVDIASQCFSETMEGEKDLMLWCKDNGYKFILDWDIVGKINGDTDNLIHREKNLSKYKELFSLKASCDPSFCKTLYKGCYPDYNVCTIGKSALAITCNGDVLPCVGFSSERLGNVNDTSINDIWNNSEELNRLRNIKLKEFTKCVCCPDKEYCNVCMQANVSCTGDVFKPDPNRCRITALLKDFAGSTNPK